MRANKTAGGLILPENAKDSQGYGRVISAGELVTEGTDIKEGDYLVYHPMAGMDMLMDKRILKVLKYEELYGILQDDGIKETLEPVIYGGTSEGQTLIQPVSRIIQ
jgi:co-chaperonin GroES (HSP10)